MSSGKNNPGQQSADVDWLLKVSPVAGALAEKPGALPAVAAPSLEDLAIHVPEPEDLSTDDLLRRFHEKRRKVARTRDRAPGEELEMGDEVQLDVLGYHEGRLIPFSARFGAWSELAPLEMLPGFAEGVSEGTVGGSVQVQLMLPDEYPVESLRGQPVRFLVDILAARSVQLLDETRPEFFKALGLGGDLDAVMNALREELEDELADQLWVEARDLALDEVARRSGVKVPPALVDTEVRRRWAEAEGRALVAHGFDAEEQEEAMQAWLSDPATREECERRLGIGLALKALTERDKLQLDRAKLVELLTAHVEPVGLTRKDVEAALREAPEQTRRLTELAWYLLAVEHVMNHAKVKFGNA